MKYLAAIAAAVTSTQVGSAMVATRFVVDQTGPISLALLRYLIGFTCLLPLALLARPRVRFERCDLLPLALLGVIQFGVLIALLNYGLRFIPSARGDTLRVYFGTQTKPNGLSHGIYVSTFDTETGKLSAPELAAEARNPGFLAIHPNRRSRTISATTR